MINGHVATALWKSEISWKSDSWFVCARVMSSHFLIPPPNYNIKAHKRGDFHQIESYGPNTVGHKSNGIPEWESRKLRWFFFTFIHVVPFTFIHLGPGTWHWYLVLLGTCAFAPLPLEPFAAPPPPEHRVCHHHGQGGDGEGWEMGK